MDDKKKIRIVHVLKSSIYSGAENVVITIIKNLQDEFDFTYIATDGPIKETLEKEHIPHILLKRFNRKSLKNAIGKCKPDIVHAHDFSATVTCAMIRGQFRLISHLHYDPPWVRRWNWKTLAYLGVATKVSRILVVSEGSYENMIFSKVLQRKVIILKNPMDINRILELGNQEKVKGYDLLFVGRFVEQKDPKQFIEIVSILSAKEKNIRCAMIGMGELWEECRYLVEKKALQNNIEFLGFQDNPYTYMKASRMLCMTSKWEGYGLVVAEANILGVPVISTRTGGVTDILGKTAVELCNNTEEFVDKIWTVLNDKSEYQRWCKRALMRQEEFSSVEKYKNQIKKIYEYKGK